jgi:hypothetical protein
MNECVWCGEPPTRVLAVDKWEFPFCSSERCVTEGTEVIKRHSFDLIWVDNEFVLRELPQTPQMGRIVAVVRNRPKA